MRKKKFMIRKKKKKSTIQQHIVNLKMDEGKLMSQKHLSGWMTRLKPLRLIYHMMGDQKLKMWETTSQKNMQEK